MAHVNKKLFYDNNETFYNDSQENKDYVKNLVEKEVMSEYIELLWEICDNNENSSNGMNEINEQLTITNFQQMTNDDH